MNKTLTVATCLTVAFCMCGCSQEERDEAANRIGKAAKALNGEVCPDDKEYDTPKIVAEQQRKERIRQNTIWTAENQACHPVEYCQAQLDEMDKHISRLEVVAHKCAVGKSKAIRNLSDVEAQIAVIDNFLSSAKKAYREADAVGKWPVMIGGYALSKEKAQEKIVEAVQKRDQSRAQIGRIRNMIAAIGKKAEWVLQEQKKAVQLKERIQTVLNDLNLKKTLEGEKSISCALDAIKDSIEALGADYDNPELSDLIIPDKTDSIKTTFNAIMAE